MYRKILVPVDGSKLSERALPHARELARAIDAEVILLEVVDSADRLLEQTDTTLHLTSGRGTETARAAQRAAGRRHSAAQEHLAELESGLRQAGLGAVSAMVREGDPREEIERAVAEHGCDLVVMSTHGRSGVGRALLGSVADHVARHTPGAPVLLVHQ